MTNQTSSTAFQFFMTLAVDITDGCGLSNKACHELLPKKRCICHLFHSKKHLISCTLLTRWSTLVLAYCVTVTILAQNNF